MNLCESSVDNIKERELYRRIEIAARTCYLSGDKAGPGTAEQMVFALIRRGHDSPLEHSRIAVRTNKPAFLGIAALAHQYERETGLPSYIAFSDDERMVSANYRAWRNFAAAMKHSPLVRCIFCGQHGFEAIEFPDLPDPPAYMDAYIYSCNEPPGGNVPDRHAIITARFICDRGVSHELVRHRLLSFSQVSTRYVSYADGVTYVKPAWWDRDDACRDAASTALIACEDAYAAMASGGAKPGKARLVLPNALMTEVVVTGTAEIWKRNVLPLRLSKAAHPDIRKVMIQFCEQMRWDPESFRK